LLLAEDTLTNYSLLFIWPTSTFDEAAQLASEPTGPPSKCQVASRPSPPMHIS